MSNKKSRIGAGVGSIFSAPDGSLPEEKNENQLEKAAIEQPQQDHASKPEVKTKKTKAGNRNSGGELVTKAFNIKTDNYERLRKLSYETKRSASVIVNEALGDYLDRADRKAAKHESS